MRWAREDEHHGFIPLLHNLDAVIAIHRDTHRNAPRAGQRLQTRLGTSMAATILYVHQSRAFMRLWDTDPHDGDERFETDSACCLRVRDHVDWSSF